jgi:hypothetical protein
MSTEIKREYLGDGAYVDWEGFQMRVWTDRGPLGVHEVFLDDIAMGGLLGFYCHNRGYAFPVMKRLSDLNLKEL